MAKFNKTPFTVSVHDIMHRPGEQREFSRDIAAPEKFGEGLISVPAGANIHLELRLESVHEGILASAEVETTAVGECGRCLEPITEDLEVEFQELFAYSLDEAFDYEVHDDHVDCEPLIRDAVVLALPFQPVCRPDCAGLDPETGERLVEPLQQDASGSTDSRWAALREVSAADDNDA
jgi:uncharacterized protein